LINIW